MLYEHSCTGLLVDRNTQFYGSWVVDCGVVENLQEPGGKHRRGGGGTEVELEERGRERGKEVGNRTVETATEWLRVTGSVTIPWGKVGNAGKSSDWWTKPRAEAKWKHMLPH